MGRYFGRVTTGGGLRAVLYTFKKAREAGGLIRFWKAMRSKNACKTSKTKTSIFTGRFLTSPRPNPPISAAKTTQK
jgi:hypothetical protein